MLEAGRDIVVDSEDKTLHQDGGERHRVVFVKTRHSRSLRYSNDGGCLEAGGNSLLQDVKNVSNNISSLIGTCFWYTARYIIWTSSFIYIHSQQDFSHILCGY